MKQPSKWPIGRKTPHKTKLSRGDKILFYQAGEEGRKFVGFGELLTALQANEEGIFDYVVVDNIELWDKPVPIVEVLDKLSFIKNKRIYGPYFQGGIKRISEEDYNCVLRKAQKKSLQRTPKLDAKSTKISEG